MSDETKPTSASPFLTGKSQDELDEGYRTFQASLKREYRKVKGRDYSFTPEIPEREIGFHVHLKPPSK